MYVLQAVLSIFWGLLGSVIVLYGATMMYKQMGYFPPEMGFLGGIPYLHPGLRIFAFFVFVMGLLTFAQMMVVKATTEIAITNVRLIYKRGLIARQIVEISIDRIESVNVLQGVLARIFNYGRLEIHGMGVGKVLLPPIENPIGFRKSIQVAQVENKRGDRV